MSIDLHTHSTASDGTDTPAELVRAAQRAGVDILAITDHDTTAGWDAAQRALPAGMTLVRGAEISCVYRGSETDRVALHLLAYLFDNGGSPLTEALDDVCSDRVTRARAMVARMEEDGLPIDWPTVDALAAGGTVGRPHLARALVLAGYVPSVDAAFAGPVGSASPYYVPKADIPVLDAIAMVRASGGVCVFAHPLRRGRHVGDEGIAEMAAAGLRGLEVDHPDHDAAAREHLAGVAAELGLVRTGSSDYHGTNKTTAIAACTTTPPDFAALVEPVRQRLLVA
ncbi:MAG: PHP domain-containing protein [bacterium]